ncbi:MAG: flavocytochrome c [Lachnospiraceae bacterium]|nr:flavocytochrome c [Lachnospiraceae bacterium]
MRKSIRQRAFAWTLTALMTVAAVPVMANAEEAVFANPGTYTATEAGINGDVTLTVTFSESEITDIQVESQETATIGAAAMETLTETVLANQSLAIDTVSGATISSTAYIAALTACVEQAGGDVEALSSREIAASDEEAYPVTEADVIVIGAGGAGLSAAKTADENGASVILIEKSSNVGGNTLCATMGINAAESQVQTDLGVTVTVEELIEAQLNNEDADEALVTAFAENSGETIDWLASLGVEFSAEGGNSDFMLMATADGKTSTTLINALNNSLTSTDITLYLNTTATTLVTDENGAVIGVVCEDADGNEVTFTGKAVVLATGGFGQNSELLAEVRPDLANAITDEIAPTTGDGLLMAQALGADTVNLEDIQLFPHVIVGYGLLTPMNLPGGFNPDAIYVNENAERFVAEGFEVSDAILAQPDGMAYCIFTENNLNETLEGLMELGYVVSGETVEELAENLGLDADALQATIDQWNADCEAGADSQFGREENLNKLEGTLYGYNFGVGAHYFMGGILINEYTQVVDTNGDAIVGLYAAGEVTGGFHGNYRVDGSGTADAFVFGRLAGKYATAYALEQ